MKTPKTPNFDPSIVKGTPNWFSRHVLGLTPYPWQDAVMWDVATGKTPVALRAANGSGKTQGIATALVLWHAATFHKSQVVTTAGVYRQVKEQLWGNLKNFEKNLGVGWKINTTDLIAPNGSKAIGFSTDNPGAFEGFHNENLLMILDEAKSIPDEIFAAVERCQPNRVLMMSSCGGSEGEFPAAFSTRRKFYSQHTVTSYDCPHLSDEWIATQIEKWGKDHPLIRSMIFSEFDDSGTTTFVCSPTRWTECLDHPPKPEVGRKLAFIDWAAGGDENVIAIVDGNRALEPICWRDKNTMAAANRAAITLSEHDVPFDNVFADDGGLGHPINDMLTTGGIPVRRVLNNMRPTQPDHYRNLGSELWFTASRAVEKKEFILPKDEVLMQQVTTRRSVLTPLGKLALEPKEQMRARGLTSPDRADAVLSAIALVKTVPNQYRDDVVFEHELSESQLLGMEETFSGSFAGL
jgi:phage terminase large subunit